MRIALLAATAVCLALAAAGCGGKDSDPPVVTAQSTSACSKNNLDLLTAGKLTVGTDNPAYPPWFGGGVPAGSTWKINDPATGKGFESAVAYAVAKQLGFARADVVWKYVPFGRAYAPGKKPFDLDVNQISYKPVRARAVDFSQSYYDVNQAVVVRNGTPIAAESTIAGLQPYKLGAQLGTTSYDTINQQINPAKTPAVFPNNAAAVQALKNGQIDGLVVDLPTAFYVTAAQVPGSKILGQFPPPADGIEHFGMVLAKGSPLTGCVDGALSRLRTDGTLAGLQEQWLAKATGAPVLK